jgi:Immunity protein 52
VTVKPEPQSYPETYYAGAYWGPRKEPPEDCARRTAALLNLLAPCDPFLAHWYEFAKSRKDARKHPLMLPYVPTLTGLFRRGVNREKGGPVFESLGLSVCIHNGGAAYDAADLRIACGGYSEAVSNSCVLSLPTPGYGPNADRVLTAPVLTNVVRGMSLAWEPDWAVATSSNHRDVLSEKGRAGTFVGWVTYLSRRRGTVPPLPAPVRIEPVADRGALIILTPERLTASNLEHVELGRRVGELLARADLMQPVIAP